MSSYQISTIYTDELGLLDETCTSHGNNCPYMDMYTWITATDNDYIPYSYPSSVKKTQKTQVCGIVLIINSKENLISVYLLEIQVCC